MSRDTNVLFFTCAVFLIEQKYSVTHVCLSVCDEVRKQRASEESTGQETSKSCGSLFGLLGLDAGGQLGLRLLGSLRERVWCTLFGEDRPRLALGIRSIKLTGLLGLSAFFAEAGTLDIGLFLADVGGCDSAACTHRDVWFEGKEERNPVMNTLVLASLAHLLFLALAHRGDGVGGLV